MIQEDLDRSAMETTAFFSDHDMPYVLAVFSPAGTEISHSYECTYSQFLAAIRDLALTVADKMTLEARCQLTDDLQKIVEEVRP